VNIGEFRTRANGREVVETSPGVYEWQPKARIHVKPEHHQYSIVFAKFGVTVRSMKVKARVCARLTLHNALMVNDPNIGHCFISDINRDTPGLLLLTVALVEPFDCNVKRTTTGKGELNRPEVTEVQSLEFPGYLVEKYIRQSQDEPMSYTEARFVLVTPKVIDLSVGEVVRVSGESYAVAIRHELDPYKNEYEVVKRGDN